MTMKKNQSLIDFAKQFERPACIACILPEREEIDGAYRSGITRKTILRWLWESKGYNETCTFDDDGKPNGISASMIDKHFTGTHHYHKEQ